MARWGSRRGRTTASSRAARLTAAASGAGLALGAVAATMGAGATPAGATTITVLNLDASGPGSLRAALAAADDGDTIDFAPGLAGTITLAPADPLVIEDFVTISGPGADRVTVTGNDASRVFIWDSTHLGGGTLSISGLTVTHGAGFYGAGLVVGCMEPFDVNLDDMAFVDGAASLAGGAVTVFGCDDLTITDSEFSGNQALYGAAVRSRSEHTTITGSQFTGNSSIAVGGPCAADCGAEASATPRTGPGRPGADVVPAVPGVIGSGGAVALITGTLSIATSTFTGNAASRGGAVGTTSYSGAVTITTSTFSGNQALVGGALDLNGEGTATVVNSTLTGNAAPVGGAIHGGAGGPMVVDQTTITANGTDPALFRVVAALPADPVGGIALDPGVSVALCGGGEVGPAVPCEPPPGAGTLTLSGTILAGNADADLCGYTVGLVSVPVPSVSAVADHSLIGSVDPSVTITLFASPTGVTDGHLRLGPLADNGGPTPTMALLDGSLAIDAGPDPVADFPGNGTDQRGAGYARISGGRADVGAFEVQIPEPRFTG